MDKDILNSKIMQNREMMKAYSDEYDEVVSDQMLGMPQPSLELTGKGTEVIPLPKEFAGILKNNNFISLIETRTSKRKYSNEPLSLTELSFLLWTTQGVKEIVGKQRKATFRTVPSAGARHPFECYLFINNVNGLKPGLYHYLAIEHQLEFMRTIENQVEKVTEAVCGQKFYGEAAVGFVWTVVPYRSEWRYSNEAQKYALIDVGHVCQNLYLACEAISCGTCAIGAYDQVLIDGLLGLDTNPSFDNDSEFVVYAASVGKQ